MIHHICPLLLAEEKNAGTEERSGLLLWLLKQLSYGGGGVGKGGLGASKYACLDRRLRRRNHSSGSEIQLVLYMYTPGVM